MGPILNVINDLITEKKSAIWGLEREIDELRKKKAQIETKNKYRKFNFHTDMPKFVAGELVIAVFNEEADKKLVNALIAFNLKVCGDPNVFNLKPFYKLGLGRVYGPFTRNQTEYDHLSYYAASGGREIVVFE